MLTITSRLKDYYELPTAEVLNMNPSSVLCSSPGDGANEDVGFEDWGDDD